MTVSNSDNRVQYYGNGSVTDFAVPFVFLQGTDLEVYLTDRSSLQETQQTITTHYTVSQESDSTGTVSFVTAPGSDKLVTIIRAVPITQLLDYVENDPFPAENNEDALDKLTMICQDLYALISRGVVIPTTSTGSTPDTGPGGGIAGLTNVFVAKVTSAPDAQTGLSSFVEQEPTAGSASWSNKSGGATGSARSTNGCLDDFSNQIVVMIAYEDDEANLDYRFEPPGPCSS